MPYTQFNDTIMKAGEEAATLLKSQQADWFQFSRDALVPHINERNEILHTLRSSADLPLSIIDSMQTSLRRLSKLAKDKVLLAKAKWAAHICSKIHDMHSNPRVAWEYIRILTGGTTGHHKRKVTMAMKMTNGKTATTSKENMEVFGPHFDTVFNNHRPVDFTFLNDVSQRPTLNEIDSPKKSAWRSIN